MANIDKSYGTLQIDDVKYSEEDITDSFVVNRECFFSQLFTLLKSRNTPSRVEELKSLDIMSYPDNVIEENGCILLSYITNELSDNIINFYIDKLTGTFCGYIYTKKLSTDMHERYKL